MIESLLLALAGGICGLTLSYPGVTALQNLPAESAPPSWVQFTLDRNVFAYLAALCAGSALVCGLVPAWQASRPNLVATLNEVGTGGGRRLDPTTALQSE